jgi:hypothetical protein
VTNQQTGLNIITEMIVGYMLPGKPIAMMMFSKAQPNLPGRRKQKGAE